MTSTTVSTVILELHAAAAVAPRERRRNKVPRRPGRPEGHLEPHIIHTPTLSPLRTVAVPWPEGQGQPLVPLP